MKFTETLQSTKYLVKYICDIILKKERKDLLISGQHKVK